MRGRVAILVELMGHIALPCLRGVNGYEMAFCNSGRKTSHTALSLLRGFNGYERVVAILVEKMSQTTLS